MMESSLFRIGDDRSRDLTGGEANAQPAGRAKESVSALYRKYRPQSFDDAELVGQGHIVRTLRNAIALDRVAHAYLFCGPRGTGKTTTARLLAKAVNCLETDPMRRPCNHCANCLAITSGASPDIIEIDAASNRGIDDIRDLRERTRYAPAQLPSKVYIIDEAHQITGAAANAFLKTLEEPPVHSRFILATTDPEELLPTIVSRCQRFDFHRVNADDMIRRLRTVAESEAIGISDEALQLIARNATGSLRDALGLLEQLSLLGAQVDSAEGTSAEITASDVRAALGLSRSDRVEALVAAIAARDAGDALRVVQDAVDIGEDPRQLNRQLLAYLRLLLHARSGANTDADERARELADRFHLLELANLVRLFSEIDFSIKHAPYPTLPLEVALVEAAVRDAENLRVSPASTSESIPQLGAAPRTSPLRDRIRGASGTQEAPPPTGGSAPRGEPAPITPIRPAGNARFGAEPGPPSASGLDVEQIADLWPSVRADVKALNRRIEALLSEVDPVAVSGTQITLAVPYPFHRDKLNSDDVRETVAGVLSRHLNMDVSLVCILRGEMANGVARMAQSGPAVPAEASTNQASAEDERAMARVRAAKNIFDAEEIDPPGLGIAAADASGS
jgi:DNA polymerase-3 subunit gamma/tau